MSDTPLLDKLLDAIESYDKSHPEKSMNVELHNGYLFEIVVWDKSADEYDATFCHSIEEVFKEIELLSLS